MKGFFRFRFQSYVPNFVKIGKKTAIVRAQTDRQSDRPTHRDHAGDLIIGPIAML